MPRNAGRLLLAMLSCCALAAQTPNLELIGVSGVYRVGSGDVIRIDVFEVEELSQSAVVAPQGTISMPLIGEVSVDGLTTPEIEGQLKKLYGSEYLRDPQIAVTVEEFRSQPVSVVGAVQRPGVYQLQGRRRLVEVLAMAGGLTESVGEKITVFRRDPEMLAGLVETPAPIFSSATDPTGTSVGPLLGVKEEIHIPVRNLLKMGDSEDLNPFIEPHDVIRVGKAGVVYVMGAVQGKGTRLVEVNFESVDRRLAATVVNTLAEEYIEHNLEAKWNATQKASGWLQQQLSTLKAQLEASETALQDYAAAHSILFVEERKDITTEKLARLEDELTNAEADRIHRQSMAMLVEDSVRRGGPLLGSLNSEAYENYRTNLSELRREHSQLLVTFAPAYPKVRRVQKQIEELEKSLEGERARLLSAVREAHQLARGRETLLRSAALSQRRKVNRLSDDFIQYNILKRDAETNRDLYEGLLQRLKQAGVSAGLRASNVAVLDPAETPQKPYQPKKLLNLVLALSAGLLLGVGLAFVKDHMNTIVRTPEEVERTTGLALLAVIPRSRRKLTRKVGTRPYRKERSSPDLPLMTFSNGTTGTKGAHRSNGANGSNGHGVPESGLVKWAPEQGLSEAYRTLRSSVLLGWDESMRRILVTSSQPEEGKTSVSLNLACSLAQLGRRVLVIDADMRRPNCNKQLGVSLEYGLTDYLQGLSELDQIITKTPIAGLSLVPAGRSSSVASDLLYSPRLVSLLQEAGRRYEHVVVDSPPSLVLSDARTISRLVEGVILVVSDKTERGSLLRTKQTFDDAGVHFLGFVMNRVNLDNLDYGYYRNYGYYYSYGGHEKHDK